MLGGEGTACFRDATRKSVEISVLGGGSSLIGGSLKTEITREEALELTLEGFLPLSARGEQPKEEKRSLFRELGLPYETDPAISKHLNVFLEGAGGQAPDAVLFNGGFFIPEICRTRVADVLEHWYGKRPEIFDHRDLDLAVATGAAYYSYVRSTGSGVLVRGGLAARLLHRDRRTERARTFRPSAWCRAAPKKARRSKWIAGIWNWWRTGPCRSGSTAR